MFAPDGNLDAASAEASCVSARTPVTSLRAATNSRITSPSTSDSSTAAGHARRPARRSIAATSCNCLASMRDLELNSGGWGRGIGVVSAGRFVPEERPMPGAVRAAACGRLVHRDDVFNGRVDLNVGVRGSQDVAAIAAEDVDQPLHFVGDVFRRPVAEHPLKIDSPIEAEVLAEVSSGPQGPSPRAGLDRLQHVDAGIDDHRQQREPTRKRAAGIFCRAGGPSRPAAGRRPRTRQNGTGLNRAPAWEQ